MKPMKFFKSEKHHFSEKIFRNIEKTPSKFNILIFAIFFGYYNRWHQSIHWRAIEILIKILIKVNPEKAVKLNSLDIFLKK